MFCSEAAYARAAPQLCRALDQMPSGEAAHGASTDEGLFWSLSPRPGVAGQVAACPPSCLLLCKPSLGACSSVLAGAHVLSECSPLAGGRLLVHMASETRKVAARAREYARGAGGLSVSEVKFAPALASFARMSARCKCHFPATPSETALPHSCMRAWSRVCAGQV